jgi:7-cyano-7-deazaguanine synthase
MDSTALAYWCKPSRAFTIDYGQAPVLGEIRAASAITAYLGIQHEIIRCDVSSLGSGDMAGSPALDIAPVPEWWPFRNQFLITVAAMRAVAVGVQRLIIGCLKTDAQHADGSAAFVTQMASLLASQEGSLSLEAPAIELTASELLQRSDVPAEVLAWAHSCHASEFACGLCRGCRKHYQTLAELGAAPY